MKNKQVQVRIEIESPIFSRILKGADLIKGCLSFSAEYFRRTQFRTVRKEYNKCLMKKEGLIYTGWIDRIKNYCSRNGLSVEVEIGDLMVALDGAIVPSLKAKLPAVEGFVELRPEQMRQVSAAIEKRRGYIVAPMALGKTIEFMSIVKKFENYNCLISVPGISLLTKTIKDLKGFGFKKVWQLGEGNKKVNKGISVATMQTLKSLDLIELSGFWDVIIVDEAHIAFRSMATYEKILSQLLAPIRLGFTATFPENPERALLAEGLLGPIIDSIGFDEATDLDAIVKPKIEFITVPIDPAIKSLKKYPEIYKAGIVENTIRNRRIIGKAKKLIDEGMVGIIFSSEKSLKHGEMLLDMAKRSGINAEYVQGSTSGEEREKLIDLVKKKKLDLIIATRVFREGVNIPSLNFLIIAKGGLAEDGSGGDEALLQTIGRALRKSKGKDFAIIVDILDPYSYLSTHCITRISKYVEMNWM